MWFLPHRCLLLIQSNLLIFSFMASGIGVILRKAFPVAHLHKHGLIVSSVMFKVSCFLFSNINPLGIYTVMR